MSSDAPGADADGARQMFERGLQLAAERRWPEAADVFGKTHQLVQRPNVAYNYASALYRVGRYVEAAAVLAQFRAWASPDNPNQAGAARLSDLVDRAIATLELHVEPADALVELDGSPTPDSGVQRRLRTDPGELQLAVSHEGYAPYSTRLVVDRGETVRQRVVLKPLPSPPLLAVPEEPAEPAAERLAAPAAATRPADQSQGLLEEPWFWVGVGATAIAAGIVGLVFATEGDPAYGGSTGMVLVVR